MKCKKCGFELDPTDEFCRHCGQRTIEDSNMTVCPHCGEVISKLMVFCPNCHKVAYKPDNAIAPPQIQETKSPAIVATPTSSGTSAPVKKPFYKSSAFITFIAILIILVLIIVPVVIYNFVTKSAIKSDFLNHGNAKMIGDVAYYYDEEWEETTFDDYVHYTKDDPYFSFSIRIEDCISKADEYDADDYIDELDDSENYEKQSVPLKYTYNNVETYHYRNIESTQIDEYYIFCYDDDLYVFDFYISNSDKTSKVAEEFILENLYFTEPSDDSYDDYTFADDYDDYYDYNYYDDYDYDYYDDYDYDYYEDETEEPTTEPPTEKPTDTTESMTLLYDDNEISVYYSDTEPGGYFSDDEVNVHLFVENKMNKSITVQADTVILDGITYNNVICSDPISANTRGMIELTVNNCTNSDPSTVGADLRYFDTNTLDNKVKLNIVSHSVK